MFSYNMKRTQQIRNAEKYIKIEFVPFKHILDNNQGYSEF